MGSPTQDLTTFAQDIYLLVKGRDFDDITGQDGQTFISQIARWVNMFVDELETETGPSGKPVDWWFSRQEGVELGTAILGDASISLPSSVSRLPTDEQRYVQVKQDSSVISNWLVVHPKDISSKTDRITEDMCAVVGGNLVFSRVFNDLESTGSIVADIIAKLPRIAYSTGSDSSGTVTATNVKLFTLVQPALLLKLGVAKNVTLPDIVQGKLSPSYAQKFKDLLDGAIARSEASAAGAIMARDNYSYVRGV